MQLNTSVLVPLWRSYRDRDPRKLGVGALEKSVLSL